MAKLSYAALQSFVTSMVTNAKLSNATYTQDTDNIGKLVGTIAKIFMLDTNYEDKLSIFDGEDFKWGRDIEEWYMNLIMPTTYDSTGAGALSPSDPTFLNNFYSTTLGKRVFKTTERYNNLERAVNNEGQFIELVSKITKKLFDSEAVYRYNIKREILANMIGEIVTANTTTTAYAVSTAYSVGTYLYNSTECGIVVKAIAATNTNTWAQAIAAGDIVVFKNQQVLAQPTTTSTGAAFIKQIKADVEKAEDISEGYSLNGNALGTAGNLVLIVKQGIMPSIDVDTLAGCFHVDKMALPAKVIVVPDFGKDTNNVYAVLMDARGVRLHNSYRAVRENLNGDGDFMNYFLHSENTGYYSRNIFCKIYKSS